jgi:hypothetical protein
VNTKGITVAAVAQRDAFVQRIDELNGEGDGKDPNHGHQRKHGSNGDEEPFLCSALKSLGAVSLPKKPFRKTGIR